MDESSIENLGEEEFTTLDDEDYFEKITYPAGFFLYRNKNYPGPIAFNATMDEFSPTEITVEDNDRTGVNMEWKSIKDYPLCPNKDAGDYLVLISNRPHIVTFGHRPWSSPWHTPIEWRDPTHYIKIPDLEGIYISKPSFCTMD